MKREKIAVFFTASIFILSLIAAGCASGIGSGEETGGKPLVINFWQPG